jgi:hypothetical protein
MEYEYIADADLMTEAKRRGASNAVTEAILLEMEQERLKRVRDDKKKAASPGRKYAADRQLPEVNKQADRARKKAATLIESSGLSPEEIAEVEQQALVSAITEKEREHVYRTAEAEQLQAELAATDDPDDRVVLEQVISQKQEELALVEIAHEVLVERRDA